MHRIFALLTVSLLALCVLAQAEESDQQTALEQFNSAYEILQKADTARDRNDLPTAVSSYKEALDAYRKFSRKNPDWESNVVRFRLLYCNDQLESCMKKIEKTAKLPPAGQAASVSPAPEQNTPPLQPPTPRKPTKAEVANAVSESLTFIEKNDPASALTLTMEYLKLEPDNRSLRLTSAVAQCKSGNYSDAVQVLESLIVEYPDDISAHMALASAYLGSGDAVKAKQTLNNVIKLNPSTKEAYYNLAQVYVNSMPPDNNNAAKNYRKWLDFGGKPDPALNHLVAKPEAK